MDERTAAIVRAIELDLKDRSGFDHVFDDMEDDILEEMRQEWAQIIANILETM